MQSRAKILTAFRSRSSWATDSTGPGSTISSRPKARSAETPRGRRSATFPIARYRPAASIRSAGEFRQTAALRGPHRSADRFPTRPATHRAAGKLYPTRRAPRPSHPHPRAPAPANKAARAVAEKAPPFARESRASPRSVQRLPGREPKRQGWPGALQRQFAPFLKPSPLR